MNFIYILKYETCVSFDEKWILFTFLSTRPVCLFDEKWILLSFRYFHHKVESLS